MSAKFLLALLLAVIVYRYWRRIERGFRAAALAQAKSRAQAGNPAQNRGPASFGPGAQGQWTNAPNAGPQASQPSTARAPVIQDLVPCPSCGSYIAPGSACNCAPMEQRRRG